MPASTELHIDLETHSEINLTTRGAYQYAMHPSTGVYNAAFAFNNETPELWVAGSGEPFPERVSEHIRGGGVIHAHNATFERLMFWFVICPDYNVPEPTIEQFQCSAARARAHGMPGALDDAVRAMGLPIRKHAEGRRLILQYSANNTPWSDIPEEDRALWNEYVVGDVEAERMLVSCLRELTDYEWSEYHLNERINDRGVPLDIEFAAAALEYADDVREEVGGKMRELTGGVIKKPTERKSRDEWVLPQLNEEQIKILTVYKKDEAKISFEQQRRDALAIHPDLPQPVARYLELLDEAGGATISKYKAMCKRNVDGRLMGALMFNGAGQTGRFSSTGLQMHNLSRVSLDEPEAVIATVIEGVYEIDNVTETLKHAVRSAIYNPSGLSWYDFSSIEGRVAPWLEGGMIGEAKLDLYRDGIDPYIYNASRTFGVAMDEVTKDLRQAGKLQELALQFLGGVGALKVMGRNYGMHITDAEGEQLRDGWRTANPWAKKYGTELDRAAMRALRRVGQWQEAGRVAYAYDGKDWLWCRLPSGRMLAYFQPCFAEVTTPWGEQRTAVEVCWGAGKPKVGEDWPRRAMHGGLWIENCTQATAADLLREAIVRVDAAGLPVILHCHDEILVEGYHLAQLGEIMLQAPAWAEGLPLAGDGGEGTRYGK